MKKFSIIVVATWSLFLFTACEHGQMPEKLDKAYNLVLVSPDSARQYLSAMADDTTEMSIGELMNYRLVSFAADIESGMTPDSGTEAKRLQSFYENNENKTLLPLLYYSMAGMYRNLGDAPQALDFYHKSVNALAGGENLRLRSSIYREMGEIFLRQHMDEAALANLQVSYGIDSLQRDTAGMLKTMLAISTVRERSNADKALELLRRVEELNRRGSCLPAEVIASRMAAILCKRQEYDSARVYLKQARLRHTCPGIRLAAGISIGKGELDSARYYCQQLLSRGDHDDRKYAARTLAGIAFKEKRYGDGEKYIHLYFTYADSSDRTDVKRIMALSNSMYNYQLSRKEADDLRVLQRRNIVLFMSLTVAGFIIMLMLAYKNIRGKQKQEQMGLRLLLLEKKHNSLTEQSRHEQECSKQEIDRLNSLLLDTRRGKGEIEAQLEAEKARLAEAMMKQQLSLQRKIETDNALENSAAMSLIRNRLRTQHHLSRQEWIQIEEEMEHLSGGFKTMLYNAYELSEQEYHICILIKLGCKNKDISTLTCREPNAISLARKRMFKKLTGSEGSAVDLDLFIKGL